MKKFGLIILLLTSIFHLTTVHAYFDNNVITQNDVNEIIDSGQMDSVDVTQKFVCFEKIPYFLIAVICFAITVVILFVINSSYKKIKLSSYANKYINENNTMITRRKDQYIRTRTIRTRRGVNNI
ncbi:MAG: hypothetical protein IJO43_03260 [Bacilli bacterium]|nr:hypothetical protein [Bacilli bacterium]